MFELSNIKIFVDGVIGGNPPTAFTKKPYADSWSQENNYCGQLRFDLATLTAVYKKSHELGFTVHAIGDGALAITLDAIDERVTFEQMIETTTLNCAYQLKCKDRRE